MKRVPIPIYGGVLIVCASHDEFDRAYAKLIKKLGVNAQPDSSPHASPGGLTTSAIVDSQPYIISGEWDKASSTRGGSTRCHEATHCAQAVAAFAAIDPLVEQEAFAYLTAWFYEQLAGVH